jgi:hypothetical protein
MDGWMDGFFFLPVVKEEEVYLISWQYLVFIFSIVQNWISHPTDI